MVPEKLKRSLRRFQRRHASFRRREIRTLIRQTHRADDDLADANKRQPTRQELRVDAEFQQALQDTETS
ncbi:MAG: hypothetical protein AB1792_11500 [Candidatus Zixiibacteriota bacterium]